MNGFSSIMKLIIFFICIPLIHSESHTFMTTYTGITGQTTAGIPEFSAVTTLDDQQIDYYDSDTKKLIPRKDWMKDYASTELWIEDTEIRKHVQQVYNNGIPVLMQRFSQSHGVHTYQRMYGCEWDDETEDSQGFDQYAYDGEDFISLDLKELRYITPVQQGMTTVQKWNNDRTQLESLERFYSYECVYWLKKFLRVSKATLEKADPPKVSLLQKNPDSPVECHVTGFLFRNTIISWRKNGQAMSDSSKLVKSGETLPNGDGTFQRRLNLSVPPDEHKETLYTCVVEHKSLTEPIQRTMTVNGTNTSILGSNASYIMYLVVIVIAVILVLIVLYLLWKLRKKFKSGVRYYKTRHSETQSMSPLEDEMLNPPPPLSPPPKS
ncbi:major histocompatibility complex class I-related gene protein-like isoform X2 [Megalobrama amblycephala]|uniref:major histocompatibility complex class I-related gene protein-like isoform X2 n=1 Tax=Megalobrama amblycephala TaxID=75352 RepID=UPI00201416C8|nr:major histocompatibility complex class I-related gene protein-like isoform X2 [Megalobrama amblycephala]